MRAQYLIFSFSIFFLIVGVIIGSYVTSSVVIKIANKAIESNFIDVKIDKNMFSDLLWRYRNNVGYYLEQPKCLS